ncbi:unnamed protein product [Phaeothamnion confervicola]
MNIFRFFGDLSHVASIVVLLLRLKAAKSAAGISLKTQELFLLVFVCRYLDLFTTYYSLYNSLMKVLYLSSTSYIVYMIRYQLPIKATYDRSQDSFLHVKFAVAPCAVIAFFTTVMWSGFRPLEVRERMIWEFSIWLEAVAIVPQLIVLQRFGEVENLTAHYVFLMGAYRALYILNWAYRANFERGYRHNWVVYIAGVVQTALFADFFYYYFLSKYRGGRLSLPS